MTLATDRPVVVDSPAIRTASDAVAAMRAVAYQVADGTITPAERAALSSIVETHRKTVETAELERRVTDLEKSHATDQRPA